MFSKVSPYLQNPDYATAYILLQYILISYIQYYNSVVYIGLKPSPRKAMHKILCKCIPDENIITVRIMCSSTTGYTDIIWW